MPSYFILPGLGNSGPLHWQTWLEKQGNRFKRIAQQEWDAPTCLDWITTIDKRLDGEDLSDVVLVGHSLACATIAHWSARYKTKIRGAVLVAPSDLEAPLYNFPATGFSPIPLNILPFQSIVIASTNDPWVSLERAQYFAKSWSSKFVNIGEAGHINADAGFGEWPFVLQLLKTNFE